MQPHGVRGGYAPPGNQQNFPGAGQRLGGGFQMAPPGGAMGKPLMPVAQEVGGVVRGLPAGRVLQADAVGLPPEPLGRPSDFGQRPVEFGAERRIEAALERPAAPLPGVAGRVDVAAGRAEGYRSPGWAEAANGTRPEGPRLEASPGQRSPPYPQGPAADQRSPLGQAAREPAAFFPSPKEQSPLSGGSPGVSPTGGSPQHGQQPPQPAAAGGSGSPKNRGEVPQPLQGRATAAAKGAYDRLHAVGAAAAGAAIDYAARAGLPNPTASAGSGQRAEQQQQQPQLTRLDRADSTSSTDTAGARLNIDQKATQRIQQLMQSKDLLRQYSSRPFKRPEMRGRTELNFHEFKEAVRIGLTDLNMQNVPDDTMMKKLFQKHKQRKDGVDQEQFEALIFRLLTFMKATEEVKVDPRLQRANSSDDANWRQEFLRENPRRIEEVYNTGKKLGEGTFGSVYLVTHKTEQKNSKPRTRVCKTISKKRADEMGTSYEQVREEFHVLKSLDHPYVLRIYESFEDKANFYIIMEPLKGGTVQDAVGISSKFTAQQWEYYCARVIYQSLAAVSYCHQRGVVHKDLKPENIMIASEKDAPTDQVHAVVVDFGLAEVFSGHSERGSSVAGTPPFMAPEVWRGNFSKSCDIWSMGVILFFLFSGQLPFWANRLEDWPAAVLKEPTWSWIGGASPGAQNTCWRMLTKSERGRPTASELLAKNPLNDWFVQHGLEKTSGISEQHFQGLMHADERSYFEKFVTRLVATQLEAGQQAKVNEAFKAFDRDGDGMLSLTELQRGLVTLGADPQKAMQVARELDAGNKGKISYSEFLAGVMDIRSKTPKERDGLLMAAWKTFNPDRNNVAKASAIQDAVVARGMTVADLPVEFLKALQKGNNGEVTFEDFKKAMDIDESRLLMRSMCAIPRA